MKRIWRIFVTVGLAALFISVGSGSIAQGSTTVNNAAPTCTDHNVPVQAGLVTWQLHGKLCIPAGGSNIVQVLVPGGTYNSIYWDFSYQPERYSYVKAMNNLGYATFNIDRIGTGASSKPLSLTLTLTAQANAVHQAIGALRNGNVGGHRFDTIVLVGHSLGSGVSILEAGTYHDVDGVIITGLSHQLNSTVITALATVLIPAPLDPVLSSRGLDAGYVTTIPGIRGKIFHSPTVDPQVIAVDEQTKDVFSLTEAPDLFGVSIVLPYSRLINVPVMLVMGQQDYLFCTGLLATDCSTPQTLKAGEDPYYSPAAQLETAIIPEAAHDLALAPTVQLYHQAVASWIQRKMAG